jgi:hypothetical protein
MRKPAVLLIALLSSGCAHGLLSSDIDADQPALAEKADKVLYACLLKEGRRLDDGRSNAQAVGLSALDACSNERSNATSAHLKGLNQVDREFTGSDVNTHQTEMATSAVLEIRSGRH